MRTLAALFLTLVAQTSVIVADTCVRIENHADEYYYMGQTHPAVNRIDEIWFGNGKFAYVTEAQKIVIDLSDSSLVFMVLRDSTYARGRLPFDWKDLVSEQTSSILQMYRRRGEVRETAETKTIGGWPSRAYRISSWIDLEDGRYSEREETAWMSKDIPIDWDLFRRVHRDLLALSNYDDELMTELLNIEGFSAATETKTYIQGFSVNSSERVVGVDRKAAPPGFYSIPSGFTKKNELTLDDLGG